MQGVRQPRKRQDGESLSSLTGLIFAVLLCVAIAIVMGQAITNRVQCIRDLRLQCRNVDAANRELEKEIGNRLAELERLKDGRYITSLALSLKLRPPDETQNVQRFRSVRTAEGNRYEQVVGFNNSRK